MDVHFHVTGSCPSTWLILLQLISHYFTDLLLSSLGFFFFFTDPHLNFMAYGQLGIRSMSSVTELMPQDSLEHLGVWYIPEATIEQMCCL